MSRGVLPGMSAFAENETRSKNADYGRKGGRRATEGGAHASDGQAALYGNPAAPRNTFTPSDTVTVPLASTSQRARTHVVASPAAARRVCTPSLTLSVPLRSASPQVVKPTRAVQIRELLSSSRLLACRIGDWS